MADIPRVPQVTPPALVNPQVHRVGQPGDRPKHHRDPEKNEEDVLELHEEELEEEARPAVGIGHFDECGEHFDIAV